jgi:hypothetical protein
MESLDIDEALAFSEFIMTRAADVWNGLPYEAGSGCNPPSSRLG